LILLFELLFFLSLLAKKFIEAERENFLYGSGVNLPDDFVPPASEK